MTNEQLAKHGFELCEMDWDCDYCLQSVPKGELFFRSTSCEYVEGDYWCRTCAEKWVAERLERMEIYARHFQLEKGA